MSNFLLYDDGSEEMDFALRACLQNHHQIFIATDVPSATAELEKREINLIIDCVHLEKGDLFEFIETIKSDVRFSRIPLAVLAAFALASKNSIIGLGDWILKSACVASFGLMCLAFTHNFWIALFVLAVIGAGMMLVIGSCTTILQTIVEESKRGRVMSFFTMGFLGAAPLGSLLAGLTADNFGLTISLVCCSVYCSIVVSILARQLPRLRQEAEPIYVPRGLLLAEEEEEILARRG